MDEKDQNLGQSPQKPEAELPGTNPKPCSSQSANSKESAGRIPISEILTPPADQPSCPEPEMTMKPKPPSSVSVHHIPAPDTTGTKIDTASGPIVLHSADSPNVTAQPDTLGIEFDDRPDGPRKGLFIFVIIIGLALLGSGGYFGYRLANQKTLSTAENTNSALAASIGYKVLSEKTSGLGNFTYDFYIPSAKVSYENISKMISAEIANKIDRKGVIVISIYDDEEAYAQITDLSSKNVTESPELQSQMKLALSHLVASADSTDWKLISSGIYKSVLNGKEIKF